MKSFSTRWRLASMTAVAVVVIFVQALMGAGPYGDEPVRPFRLIGNIYYVGASDLTSFLITTPEGNILLDGALAETAPQIESNISALGFKLRDTKLLLNSHAHLDHAGGLAELKRVTGAKMAASAGDRAALEDGDHHDFAWPGRLTFPPVKVDRVVNDGEAITLGGTSLTAHVTPGHTKGCTTWTMKVQDQGHTYNVVFVCSTSAPGYKLVNNPAYPNIVSDYEHTFQVLRSLPCDVFLAAHGSFFALNEKRRRLEAGGPNPFVAPRDYIEYLDRSQAGFEAELSKQRVSTRQ